MDFLLAEPSTDSFSFATAALAERPAPMARGGGIPQPGIGGLDDPTRWSDCWSAMDGQARLGLTAERVLLWADNKARAAIAAGDGLHLRGMRLEPSDHSALGRFSELLTVREGDVRSLCLSRGRRGGHLLMRASRLIDSDGLQLIGVSFRSTGPEFEPIWADMSEIFGLTAAEHRIVRELLCGKSAERIAVGSGVSIDTVRTHIRHAYEKMEVSSREDLWRRAAPYRLN